MKQPQGLFRYQQIARKIEAVITDLKLGPGDRLPSVRRICAELKVSATTVFHAYTILESQGLIAVRPRSGFFVVQPPQQALPLSSQEKYIPLPNQVNLTRLIGNMQRNIASRGLINFGIVAPANQHLPISAMNRCIRESLKDTNSPSFQYPLIEGHPRLTGQIARRSFEWQFPLRVDEVLVTNGCIEAINLCLDAVARPGDIIIVESPAPYGILQSLENKKLFALEIPGSTGEGIDLDQLEIALSRHRVAACLITTVCGAPVGNAMSEVSILRLLDILHKASVPLIEDDALGDLSFVQPKPLPAKAYDAHNQVLYCSSFSKSLGAGFRIGWVSGGPYHQQLQEIKYTTNFFTNSMIQDAIGRFLESGQFNSHLKKMRKALEKNLSKYLRSVYRHFPSGAEIAEVKGGFSLWIKLPGNLDAMTLTGRAIHEGIGIFPGHLFSASGQYNNYIRINYCLPWNTRIDHYIYKLGLLIKNY